jgi:hypothetical protein
MRGTQHTTIVFRSASLRRRPESHTYNFPRLSTLTVFHTGKEETIFFIISEYSCHTVTPSHGTTLTIERGEVKTSFVTQLLNLLCH